MHDGALLSWRCWTLVCQWEEVNECFVLLEHTVFTLPIKLSLSWFTSFCTSSWLIPSHIPLGKWVSSCTELLAGVKSEQTSWSGKSSKLSLLLMTERNLTFSGTGLQADLPPWYLLEDQDSNDLEDFWNALMTTSWHKWSKSWQGKVLCWTWYKQERTV